MAQPFSHLQAFKFYVFNLNTNDLRYLDHSNMLGKILFTSPYKLQASLLNCVIGIFPNQVVNHLLSLMPQ